MEGGLHYEYINKACADCSLDFKRFNTVRILSAEGICLYGLVIAFMIRGKLLAMKMFLISDNVDTCTGMRLAGVDGIVVHEKEELSRALEKEYADFLFRGGEKNV